MEREAGTTAMRKLIAAVAVLLVVVAIATGAFLEGRSSALVELEHLVAQFARTESFGAVAREGRDELAQAYDDPARAAAEMDSFSWMPPPFPTPFIGAAPLPGDPPGAHINAQQFRHPVDLEIPKPPGTFRVFLTGGSTAYGSAAPSDDATIGAFLQERIERELAPHTGLRYEIVNAAYPAWASTHERIWIVNRLSELEPDLVVSLSGTNDAHFGFLGQHVLSFRTYPEHLFGMIVQEVLGIVGDGPVDPTTMWDRTADGHVAPEEVARRLEKNLRIASVALEPTGAPYVFCLQPNLATTEKGLSTRELGNLWKERLGAGVTQYFRDCYAVFRERLPALDLPGFHFVDASGFLDDRGRDEEIFLDAYHFGDRGNRILAERLFEALRPFLDLR